jgi:hypothetical protein
MPYNVVKRGDKFAIIRTSDHKTVGTSETRAKAEASIRARMANEHGGGKGGTSGKRRS